MYKFTQVYLEYFEERLPFFSFTLPILLMLYPFILSLVPLYLLPKYYPLHLLYLFFMVSNLRLLRDIVEKRVDQRALGIFKKLYFANSIGLLVFCALFGHLERGQIISSFIVNWRSFFFFFSSFSILIIFWLWYFILRGLVKRGAFRELLPHIKYPLFLIPPLLLNIHESQIHLIVLYMSVLLLHSFIFEVLKNKDLRGPYLARILIFLYTAVTIIASYFSVFQPIFSSVFAFVGLIYLYKGEKLNQNLIFGPTLLLGWGILFLNLFSN